MRLARYTICALLFVVASPLAFVEWIVELRRRARLRQEAEQTQWSDPDE